MTFTTFSSSRTGNQKHEILFPAKQQSFTFPQGCFLRRIMSNSNSPHSHPKLPNFKVSRPAYPFNLAVNPLGHQLYLSHRVWVIKLSTLGQATIYNKFMALSAAKKRESPFWYRSRLWNPFVVVYSGSRLLVECVRNFRHFNMWTLWLNSLRRSMCFTCLFFSFFLILLQKSLYV